MKPDLARVVLQQADILLLDEPTNHVDGINVAWVKTNLNCLKDVTCTIVSHEPGLLNHCCTNTHCIENLKLGIFQGNLDEFAKIYRSLVYTDVHAYFSLVASSKKSKCIPTKTEFFSTSPPHQVSLSSRVACIGAKCAGKSTMIKPFVEQSEPQEGAIWKRPNACTALYSS